MYRAARVFRVFEGTNEINRLTVLDQMLRPIGSGRLNLAAEAGASPSQERSAMLLPQMNSDHGASLEAVGRQVDLMRGITQAVLQAEIDAQGEQVNRNQCFAAAVADLAAALFALESAWLRASRLHRAPTSSPAHEGEPSPISLPLAATLAYVSAARAQVEQLAQTALSTLQKADGCETAAGLLRALRDLSADNPFTLYQQIAGIVVEGV